MTDWSFMDVDDHKKTTDDWQEIWEVNRNFEQDIMNEEKGFRLEMRDLKNHHRTKYQSTIEKYQMHIEVLEQSLNEIKTKSMEQVNRLEMQIADSESL